MAELRTNGLEQELVGQRAARLSPNAKRDVSTKRAREQADAEQTRKLERVARRSTGRAA